MDLGYDDMMCNAIKGLIEEIDMGLRTALDWLVVVKCK